MTLDPEQTSLLRRALRLAEIAREGGDPPFGSLLADGAGRILAEETNTTLTDDDITAHPELKIARWAARTLTAEELRQTMLFTSCEPCPMCSNAIERARIPVVVFALSNAQLASLKSEDTPPVGTPFRASGPHLPADSARPATGYYT